MVLSPKLQKLYDLVPDGAKVVDVGTDHAFLPIALYKNKKASHIIACDIAEKPLNFAKKHLRESGCWDGVSLRQSDGLQAVGREEIDTVVIAGMGGEVIAGIMQRCTYAKDASLLWLLQPMTSAGQLRTYLYENGFAVLSETAVYEKDRVYTIMSVRYDAKKRHLSPGGYFIGSLTGKTTAEQRYIQKKLSLIASCLKEFEQLSDTGEQVSFYKEAQREILAVTEKNHGS